MEQPNYYAVIPAEVRYANIKANAKLLYWEITALANKTGECFASNKYFADLYWVSEKQVSIRIKELVQHGFCISRIEQWEGNKRFIAINQKVMASTPKGKDPSTPKGKDNNTSNNSKNNNKNNIWDKDPKLQGHMDQFVKFRKEIKQPMTDHAIELAYKKLETLAPNDIDMQCEIINQSILSWWTSLYPVKASVGKELSAAPIDDKDFTQLESFYPHARWYDRNEAYAEYQKLLQMHDKKILLEEALLTKLVAQETGTEFIPWFTKWLRSFQPRSQEKLRDDLSTITDMIERLALQPDTEQHKNFWAPIWDTFGRKRRADMVMPIREAKRKARMQKIFSD